MVASIATRKDAFQLMLNGATALADVEANGICIDMEYCLKTDEKLTRQIKKIKTKLDNTEIIKKWR